jgi:fumarate reductase flavoprotein subunit
MFDVVVVGGGGSGLAAALEAADRGASVALIEKGRELGGTTALSVGSFAAAGTAIQRAAGIVDDEDAYLADLERCFPEHRNRDNLDLRRLLVARSTETLVWLMELGLRFHGPFPDPPQRVARLHNVLPSSRAYVHTLARHCRRRGVAFLLETRARRLLTDGGTVVGVEAERDGANLEVRARRGIVLASGDLSASPEFRRRFLPQFAGIDAINPGSNGDGQAMGEAAGGRVLNGDVVTGPIIRFPLADGRSLAHGLPPTPLVAAVAKWWLETMPDRLIRSAVMRFLTVMLAPSPALLEHGAILVDATGGALPSDASSPAVALARSGPREGYFVFDRRMADLLDGPAHFVSGGPGIAQARLSDYRRYRSELYRQAATCERLAKALGMDAARLKASIDRHNAAAPNRRVDTPPFHALGPVRPLILVAEASLAVTTGMAVTDGSGSPIPGLFAAGSTGQGGMLLPAHGQHLAWAFVSGRIAGRSAASRFA